MTDQSGPDNDRISSQPFVATMDLDVSDEHGHSPSPWKIVDILPVLHSKVNAGDDSGSSSGRSSPVSDLLHLSTHNLYV